MKVYNKGIPHEVRTNAELQPHPHIVKLRGIVIDRVTHPPTHMEVLELCAGGELFDHLLEDDTDLGHRSR